MDVRDLGGHSGCKILLYEGDDNETFVRKISGNETYNKRLEIQVNKQIDFTNNVIKTPMVLDKGYTEKGLFYFDMEYIQGITMAEYMNNIEVGKVKGLVETIVDNTIAASSVEIEVDESIFANKIYALSKTLCSQCNPIINEALELLAAHSWKRFIKTPCHGDLTLENIIVKDDQLYLIDFLDSFYDSWIMDVSTLMQDVQTLWSYRYQKEININTLIRLKVFRDILLDRIRITAPEDIVEIYYALLLKLVRIYPYTKDELTYEFLNNKTKSIICIIKNGGVLR